MQLYNLQIPPNPRDTYLQFHHRRNNRPYLLLFASLKILKKIFLSECTEEARLKTSTPNFTFRCLMLIRLGKLLARLQGSLHCRLTNYVSNLEGRTGSIDPCGIRNSVCHLPNIKYSYPNVYNVFRETWYNNTITLCQFESALWAEKIVLLENKNSISKSDTFVLIIVVDMKKNVIPSIICWWNGRIVRN